MNPDECEAAVRAYYDRIDADDYEGVFELFADDVVYHRPGQEAIRGIDALRRFYREARPLSRGGHEVDVFLVDGNRVAVRGRFVGEQAGAPVEFGFADFHRFEDGAIVERHTYTDRDEV